MGREAPEPLSPRGLAPPLAARLGVLGIASAALDVGATVIKLPVARAGVTAGDLIEVITPYVLILLYAWVGVAVLGSGSAPPGGAGRPEAASAPPRGGTGIRILLAVAGIALVFGHGVHVAANSIHDMIERAGLPDPGGLIYWWDERVSHYAIDSAKAALCIGLTALERRSSLPAGGTAGAGGPLVGILFAVGALAYGFVTFADAVEGQTVPLVLPFAVAYTIWALFCGGAIVRRFFAAGAVASLALFAIWGVWHRGFPEFTAVGLLP